MYGDPDLLLLITAENSDDDSTNKNMTRIIANCEDTRIQQDKNGKIAQLPQR